MKTKISVIVVLFFLCAGSFAQIKLGFRAGLNVSSIKSDNVSVNSVSLESVSNSIAGYHFGVVCQIAFLGYYLQPELLFTRTGGQIRVNDGVNINQLVDQKFSRFDIPVIFGKKFGPLRLGLGPVFSTILSAKSELSSLQGYDDEFKKATIGYQLDLGLDIWKIGFDVKYEGNLSKLGDGINILGTHRSFDSRAHQFIFGAAYYF
jgi:hypothetical protein